MTEGRCSLEVFESLASARGGDEGVTLVEIATWAQHEFRHLVGLSGFKVGAAVLTEVGVFAGVNMEMGDLCISMHGEQSAVHHALSSGAPTPFKRIGITASPCGLCRQLLNETTDGGKITASVLDKEDRALAWYLPDAFSPAVVGKHELGSGPKFTAVLAGAGGKASPAVEEPFADLFAAAKATLEQRSQACWTLAPAGVALRVCGAEQNTPVVVTGAFLEAAAHNPTVNPAAGAVNKALLAGLSPEDVTHVAVVYAVSQSLHHRSNIARVLELLLPHLQGESIQYYPVTATALQ
eukprot:TRINITY_DN32739_c0_g1_i1.p1 TRINITY_DN32739_c0_g1~~TRINITY_DN32739_c0_g1_i1.p1  ORF type:complete len:332 (+),score=97.02 TRINITY_DN32739_c0_g1_i1:114-998(+)